MLKIPINISTGSMLGNYGGHRARVFRVEFSPSDPDLLFSCAEENSLHSWQPSKLTSNTPAESTGKEVEFVVLLYVLLCWCCVF